MNFIYAPGTASGQPIPGFGAEEIDLREQLSRAPVSAQSVYLTSRGIVYKDLLIVGRRNP